MSSSFIAIKAITKKGTQFVAELNGEETGIDVEVHDGTFRISAKDLESIKTGADILKKMYGWFYESLEDPAFAFEEEDEAYDTYGAGNIAEIKALRKDDLRFVGFFSRIEYWDEPFGASLIGYDYTTQALTEEHREEIPYSDQEDCYGEQLYDRFLSEAFCAVTSTTKSSAQSESCDSFDVSSVGDSASIGGMTWTVIAVTEENALLLANKIVKEEPYNKPYNKRCTGVTWENCTLRKWLNEEYYNKLPESVKCRVVEAENENPDNESTGVSGGKKTTDKVFVLSLKEIEMYLPNDSDRAIGEYWRTRTPGEENRQALVIGPDGSWLQYDDCWVEFKYGIRPAIWIKR